MPVGLFVEKNKKHSVMKSLAGNLLTYTAVTFNGHQQLYLELNN